MKIQEARILIADDEPQLRNIFQRWLERMGCTQVRTACNGAEALAQLRQAPADLLISDVRMPVMDGISLVRSLRAEAIAPLRVILVSGFGDIDRREMYSLGVEAFLAKPLSVSDLSAQVTQSLTDRREMWQVPFAARPSQTLALQGVDLYDRDTARPANTPTLAVGRGGFSISQCGTLTLGKVAFDLNFMQEDRRLAGYGFVRWLSHPAGTAGIEFAWLDEPGRAWLLEMLPANLHNGYIPSLQSPAPPHGAICPEIAF